MPIPAEVAEIPQKSVRVLVYEQLRDWIIQGVLAPGEKISDKDIATRFDISKTPVREAFQTLEAQKLIQTFPRKETRVTELLTDNIEELYLPIIALEELSVSLACKHIQDADILRLEALNKDVANVAATGDPLIIMRTDRTFHDAITEIARNSYVRDFLETLQCGVQRLEYIFFKQGFALENSFNNHEQLIDALRRRDEKTASAIIRQQWVYSMEKLTAILNEQKSPD